MIQGLGDCRISGRHFTIVENPLAADVAADEIAEQFPTLAMEFPELKLFYRSEVSCIGVDRDAGQESFQLQILDVGGLPHDVRTSKIVAALLENMNHGLRDIVAGHY